MVVVNIKLALVRFVQDQVLESKSRDEKHLVDLDRSPGLLRIWRAILRDQFSIRIIRFLLPFCKGETLG